MSRGATFTISREEACRKIAQYGLDTPERALLRLVQLGVASGARRVEIQIDRACVRIHFWKVDRGALFEHEIAEPVRIALLGCLHTGFAGGVFRNPAVEWTLQPEVFSTTTPSIGSEPTGNRNLPGQVSIELRRVVPVTGFWKGLFSNLRDRTNEYATLVSHLYHSPVEILVDKLRPSLAIAEEPVDSRLFLLGPRQLFTEGVSALRRVESNFRTHQISRAGTAEYFYPTHPAWNQTQVSTDCILAQLDFGSEGSTEGELQFVKHGVTVGSVGWPFEGKVDGVVSAAGVDLDVSGLNLVRNEKLQRLMMYFRDELARRT